MSASRRGPGPRELLSLVIGGSVTAPTPGTIAINKYWFQYIEKKLILLSLQWVQSTAGSSGSGIYLFPMPPGLQIDHAFATFYNDSGFTDLGALGSGWAEGTGTARNIIPTAYDANNLALWDVGAPNLYVGSANFALANPNQRIFFEALIPIL